MILGWLVKRKSTTNCIFWRLGFFVEEWIKQEQIYESSMNKKYTVGRPNKVWLDRENEALKKKRYWKYEERRKCTHVVGTKGVCRERGIHTK